MSLAYEDFTPMKKTLHTDSRGRAPLGSFAEFADADVDD